MIKYAVIDLHTKLPVGKPYITRNRARGVANRKDLEYGAIRYGTKPVEVADK